MIRFADDIRIWRLTYRMSQAQAADLANVSLTTWSRWERGVTYPEEDHYNTVRWLIAQPPPSYFRAHPELDDVSGLGAAIADGVRR